MLRRFFSSSASLGPNSLSSFATSSFCSSVRLSLTSSGRKRITVGFRWALPFFPFPFFCLSAAASDEANSNVSESVKIIRVACLIAASPSSDCFKKQVLATYKSLRPFPHVYSRCAVCLDYLEMIPRMRQGVNRPVTREGLDYGLGHSTHGRLVRPSGLRGRICDQGREGIPFCPLRFRNHADSRTHTECFKVAGV